MVALNLYVYALTGSALGMGLFLVLRLASGAAAGLVAGALVARLSRKQVMLADSRLVALICRRDLDPAPAREVPRLRAGGISPQRTIEVAGEDDLLCLLHTSGSTGTPRG